MTFNAEQVLADFEKWLEEIKTKPMDTASYCVLDEAHGMLDSLKKQSAIEELKEEIEYISSSLQPPCPETINEVFVSDAVLARARLSELEKQLKELKENQ